MTDEELRQGYIDESMKNLGRFTILTSKGRAWIEIIEGEGMKYTGVTDEDARQAGVIQLMFEHLLKKTKSIEDIQHALDHFGWNITLTEIDGKVTFDGEDKFLVIQMAFYIGQMTPKEYAEAYRETLEKGERIYI